MADPNNLFSPGEHAGVVANDLLDLGLDPSRLGTDLLADFNRKFGIHLPENIDLVTFAFIVRMTKIAAEGKDG